MKERGQGQEQGQGMCFTVREQAFDMVLHQTKTDAYEHQWGRGMCFAMREQEADLTQCG